MLKEIDLARTDLNLLALFEVVLEARHVGRAAQRLNLTPSAVSHGLGRLRRLLNDPLFLRTPKGVVPTARATELAAPISAVLAQARKVLSSAEPFDPGRSERRFTIGAPDAISAVVVPPLLAELAKRAPGIDLALRQLLPTPGESTPERAWQGVFADLEARAVDVAVIPGVPAPRRFHALGLYEEDFVVAVRRGNSFAKDPTLERYCEMQHVLVSLVGDPHGIVDKALEKRGRSRHIALTVPSFMFALAVVAETDLVCAFPRQFVKMYGPRFGVVGRESPLPLPTYRISAIVSKVALMDGGVEWLFELLASGTQALTKHSKARFVAHRNEKALAARLRR